MTTTHQTTDSQTRPLPGRRAVAKGMAWAAPVVAASAATPALAASCAPVTYTGAFTQADVYGDPPTSYTWTNADGDTITLAVSTSAYGGRILAPNNLHSAGGIKEGYNGLGDLRDDGLLLQHRDSSGGQVLTITFSEPVTDLTLTVADIDWLTRKYRDSVVLSPAPTTVSNGPAVQGGGTTSAPLTSRTNGEVNSSEPANRSTVTYDGPVSSFTLDFSSTDGTTSQQIFLTDLTFTAC